MPPPFTKLNGRLDRICAQYAPLDGNSFLWPSVLSLALSQLTFPVRAPGKYVEI